MADAVGMFRYPDGQRISGRVGEVALIVFIRKWWSLTGLTSGWHTGPRLAYSIVEHSQGHKRPTLWFSIHRVRIGLLYRGAFTGPRLA